MIKKSGLMENGRERRREKRNKDEKVIERKEE